MVGESQTRNNNGCAHAFLSEGSLVRKKKWNKKLGTTCSLDIENELGTFAMFVREREEMGWGPIPANLPPAGHVPDSKCHRLGPLFENTTLASQKLQTARTV